MSVTIAVLMMMAQAPVRPPVPMVNDRAWIQIPLDVYILARYEKEGIRPPTEPAKQVQLRRLMKALTGQEPTDAEVKAFIETRDKRAYEKEMERLLALPVVAERFQDIAGLMNKEDPATARLAANEAWRKLTGRKLSGKAHGHPDALEWLAAEIINPTLVNCCDLDNVPQAWDVKHLLRAIVSSAAFRNQ
jgi:hypothetical protein